MTTIFILGLCFGFPFGGVAGALCVLLGDKS